METINQTIQNLIDRPPLIQSPLPVGPYPFRTSGFHMIDEPPEHTLVVCRYCYWLARYYKNANPGAMGTELLLHYLKHSCGTASLEGLIFAADDWNPTREDWAEYEARVSEDFLAAVSEHVVMETVRARIRNERLTDQALKLFYAIGNALFDILDTDQLERIMHLKNLTDMAYLRYRRRLVRKNSLEGN